ncbi:unnamed protein product, partial [Prorocentrum cordatum]
MPRAAIPQPSQPQPSDPCPTTGQALEERRLRELHGHAARAGVRGVRVLRSAVFPQAEDLRGRPAGGRLLHGPALQGGPCGPTDGAAASLAGHAGSLLPQFLESSYHWLPFWYSFVIQQRFGETVFACWNAAFGSTLGVAGSVLLNYLMPGGAGPLSQ